MVNWSFISNGRSRPRSLSHSPRNSKCLDLEPKSSESDTSYQAGDLTFSRQVVLRIRRCLLSQFIAQSVETRRLECTMYFRLNRGLNNLHPASLCSRPCSFSIHNHSHITTTSAYSSLTNMASSKPIAFVFGKAHHVVEASRGLLKDQLDSKPHPKISCELRTPVS